MQLPAVLDFPAVAPLWASLMAVRGRPLVLDASCVERLGSACLQALLAAQQQWRAEGMAFRIDQPSAVFAESARMMAAERLLTSGDAP